jgi:hypothetical protein
MLDNEQVPDFILCFSSLSCIYSSGVASDRQVMIQLIKADNGETSTVPVYGPVLTDAALILFYFNYFW